MTLRKRLLSGLLLMLGLFVAGATWTVMAQRAHLYDQVDQQLLTTPPPIFSMGVGRAPAPDFEAPISTLYLARIEDDETLTVLIQGSRLSDVPQAARFLTNSPSEPTLATVPGEMDQHKFRVLYIPSAGGQSAGVIALPLDDVDATVRNLVYTSAIIAALMAVAAAMVASWVKRFGLKPINEMTAVADAIAAGDTSTRVGAYDSETEAGRLGNALNLMLDERDRGESILRSFVSDASHELRTPLTSIRGYLDLYEQGAFRGHGQLDDVVRRMKIESARMNLLVEDLLLLAKLDEQQPIAVTRVDVTLMLSDVAASARATHPDRSIRFEPGAHPVILHAADLLRLQQAVASLVDNAITHTKGAVVLRAQSGDSTTSVTVADAGPGLEPEVAERMFDRFYRGDSSRSRLAGGSGLGLSIAKSIIEAHDGSIKVETGPTRGSVFIVELPTLGIAPTHVATNRLAGDASDADPPAIS